MKLSEKGIFERSRSSNCHNFPLGAHHGRPFLRIFKNTLLSALFCIAQMGVTKLLHFLFLYYCFYCYAEITGTVMLIMQSQINELFCISNKPRKIRILSFLVFTSWIENFENNKSNTIFCVCWF